MATVTDWEDIRAEVIFAFADALRIVREEEAADNWGSERHQAAVQSAFDVANRLGWDEQADEDFMQWASKATEQEILAEGLVRALDKIHPPLPPKEWSPRGRKGRR